MQDGVPRLCRNFPRHEITSSPACSRCPFAKVSEGSPSHWANYTPLIFALLVAIAIVAYPKFSGVQPANTPTVANSPAKPQTISGRASVIDGDTIEIHGIRIRLFGIDAPETGQTCAVQGKAIPLASELRSRLQTKSRAKLSSAVLKTKIVMVAM